MIKKVIMLIILIGFCTFIKGSWEINIYQVISHMVYVSKVKVVEYGIQTSFETSNIISEKERANDILKSLVEGVSISSTDYEEKADLYSISFQGNKVLGFVEGTGSSYKTKFMINFVAKAPKDELIALKERVDKILSNQAKITNVHSYLYLKGEIQGNNLKVIDDNIINNLNYMGVSNIDTVPLKDGTSTVCFTGGKDNIKNNGKLMDLNLAVMKYNDGNCDRSYLIMGTPLINVSY